MSRWLTVVGLVAIFVLQPGVALAHNPVEPGSDLFGMVRFDQKLDGQVPLDLPFRDEIGRTVKLRNLLSDKPVILVVSYFECTTLCPLVRTGLVDALRSLKFNAGEDFDALLFSIDPKESVETAKRVKQETVAEYGRAGSEIGWHFLTGAHDDIDKLADAIGFRYAYDGEHQEYAHPSGVVLLTPQGKIARYFFGIEYDPKDLRLGLVEASHNQIGTPIDRLLLLCYHYDPTAGKYSLLIMNVMRAAALLTVVLMGIFILWMWRREAQRTAVPN
jgi:protein SCO1